VKTQKQKIRENTTVKNCPKPEISSSILRKCKQIKAPSGGVTQLSVYASESTQFCEKSCSVAKNARQSPTERGRQNHDEVIIKFF